ncbi:MAG: hypothetical protein AB1465_05590 [Patescibacteria group bacterium]
MKPYKIIIAIVICLIMIAATFSFLWPIYKNKFKEKEISVPENTVIETATPELILPQTRFELIKYIEENINNFANTEPQDIEKWRIVRFGFESNKDENIYVEFEDGHALLKVLLWCKNFEAKFECNKINTFEPNNFEWKIDQGKDSFADRVIYYYEKENNEWRLVGNSTNLRFFPISRDSQIGIQKTVDQDYLNWRKSPLSVLRQDTPKEFGFDINRDPFKPISRDEKKGKIIYQITFNNKEVWNVILFQPIKKGEKGVWVIESMHKVK